MKWYDKYLVWYNKPIDSVGQDVINSIRNAIPNTIDEPLVSVILIAHNEGEHLVSCIWSLLENKCNFPIEIFAVNNNSTDNTEDVLKKLGINYYNEVQKGPGYARQCGLDHARGKYHLCIDSDTMYPPYYIATHVKELMRPGVVCTYSLWSFIPDDSHSKFALWLYELLRDFYLYFQNVKRPELCVRGMSFGFNTDIARGIGFRKDIIRGEDGSLALAMKAFGRLVLIKSRKARVLTGNNTLDSKGSIFNNALLRLVKALKSFTGLFYSKNKYEDKDDNLLK